jgi:hypothetical protein
MAETLTVGGADLSAYVAWDSLKIEQAGGDFAAICSFRLNDILSALTIDTRDAVVFADGATILFAGEVVNVTDDLLALALDGRRLTVTCHDYNILVEEAIIDSLENYIATSDSDIIDDLLTRYRPDIDGVTYVSTLDASMDISFADVSVRQALADICARTGGRWYIDEAMNLHYFDAEANVAAWFLSDTPDNATSFPYQNIKRRMDAPTIVNQVLVVGKPLDDGMPGLRDWYVDAASVAAYGERPAVVVDNSITTQAGLDARGAAVLGAWSEPRFIYEVTTRQVGLRAGMDVHLVCGAWGIDETLTIRRLTIFWRGGYRFYNLELGDGVAPAVTTGRKWMDRLGQISRELLTVNGTIYDTDAPAVPDLQVANLSSGVDIDADGHQVVYLQMTWGSVADADLNHYELQISTSSDFSGYTITRPHAADGSRLERFLPVLGNTLYYARVRAVDWVGNTSAWSTVRSITTAKDTTPPASVTGFTALATPLSVNLTWNANTEGDLSHYEIQRKEVAGAYATIATIQGTLLIDIDVVFGTSYLYQIRATDTSGNSSAYVEIGAPVTPDSISGDWTDLGLLGWTHSLVFSAADNNTIAWTAGDINLPAGTTYNIDAGNTGDIAAITYIFLDTAVSVTVLQLTTTASAATGAHRLLIAVCQNVAAGSLAVFQVFGGSATSGILVTADVIAANTITANEIAANTITASEIAANTITASEIAANTITAAQIAAFTITAAEIAAATITADRLNVLTLSAISADLGTITAGTVTGATIRTAAAGARIVLDSVNGIQAFNAAAAQTISILPSGAGWIGTAASIAWNTAGGVTIDGGLLVNGTIVATAFSNQIGAPLFSAANGMALWSGQTAITTTAWYSTRQQVATISGAFHTEAGAWAGTRGAVIEVGTVNYCPRPRMVDADSSGMADGWTLYETCAAVITQTVGAHPITNRGYLQRTQYTANASDAAEALTYYIDTAAASFAAGEACTVSVDCKGVVSGVTVTLLVRALTAANASLGSSSVTLTLAAGTVKRVSVTYASLPATTDHVRVEFVHGSIDNGDTIDTYFGAAQIEKKAVATSFAAGNLGSGYAWTGTADASTSARTVTTLTLTSCVGLISGNDTLTYRLVAQMPYAADATWPRGSGYNYLFHAAGAATNDIILAYDETDDKFSVYLAAGERLQSSVQTFAAGDWIDLVLTVDYTANDYRLYVNGELDGDDNTGLAPPVLTSWTLGHATSNTNQAGATIAEYAVLDAVLTADEIAALYITNRPLVDAGAIDKPGIYLYDGKFVLASNTTGARTQIDATGIWAYDASSNAAFGLSLADGKSWGGFTINKSDLVLGHNRAGSAAILWDQSEGTFGFYGGGSATVQIVIATDGTLTAGSGAIKISSAANILFSISAANQGLSWFSDAAFTVGAGYINVASGGTNTMTIASKGSSSADFPDIYFRSESTTTQRTPLVLYGDEKVAEFNGAVIIGSGTSDPASPSDGMLFFRSDSGVLKLYASGWSVVATL